MREDDAVGVWSAFQKNGHSGMWTIAAALLVAAGCSKKDADCEKAVNNLVDVTKSDLFKAMPGVDDATVAKMKSTGVARCKEDKWPDEAVTCLAQAGSSADVQSCQGKMPSEVVQKFSLAVLSLNPAPAPTRSAAPEDAKASVEQYIKQHWPGGHRKDATSSAFWDCYGSSAGPPSVTGAFDLSTKERIAEVDAHIYLPVKGAVEEAAVEITLVQAGDAWKCDAKNSRLKPARAGTTNAPDLGMDACAAFELACKASEPTPPASASAVPDAGATDAAPATSSSDSLETAKQLGSLTYTLKQFEFKGKKVTVELLVKNESTDGAILSSVVGFDAITDEGDQGKLDMNGKCDGVVPPSGVLKCRLAYQFPKPLTHVQLQVKDLENAAYFKLAADHTQ